MSNEKGKLVYEEKDYINNAWKEGPFGYLLTFWGLYILPVGFVVIYATITKGMKKEMLIYALAICSTLSLVFYLGYLMANKGPIRIYENGIDYPLESIQRKRKYVPFDEIGGIFLNQSQDAAKKNVYKHRLEMSGMAFFVSGEWLFFSFPQTQKIVPILQELLEERWNELIGNLGDFNRLTIRGMRLATLVDKGKEYVYPKEYEWHPEGGGKEEDEGVG